MSAPPGLDAVTIYGNVTTSHSFSGPHRPRQMMRRRLPPLDFETRAKRGGVTQSMKRSPTASTAQGFSNISAFPDILFYVTGESRTRLLSDR